MIPSHYDPQKHIQHVAVAPRAEGILDQREITIQSYQVTIPFDFARLNQGIESAFSFVNNDSGYNQAVWLMTQLGLAAGPEKPLDYLRSQGINIPDNTSLPGVAVALTEALDNHSSANGGHSDLGELAQRAGRGRFHLAIAL